MQRGQPGKIARNLDLPKPGLARIAADCIGLG